MAYTIVREIYNSNNYFVIRSLLYSSLHAVLSKFLFICVFAISCLRFYNKKFFCTIILINFVDDPCPYTIL